MNTYEFLLLLAHIGLMPDHLKYAGDKASEALKEGRITHDHNAVEWLSTVDFETAPNGPPMWVAYAYLLMRMPCEWVVQGLPSGEDRTKAANYIHANLGAPSFVDDKQLA